jgi:hypothetical protein
LLRNVFYYKNSSDEESDEKTKVASELFDEILLVFIMAIFEIWGILMVLFRLASFFIWNSNNFPCFMWPCPYLS